MAPQGIILHHTYSMWLAQPQDSKGETVSVDSGIFFFLLLFRNKFEFTLVDKNKKNNGQEKYP